MLNIGLMKEKGLLNDWNDDISPSTVFEGAAKLGNPNGILYAGLKKRPYEER